MKRKLVRQGHATLTISLPSKWLKTFNLSAGNEIDMDEEGNQLIISAGKGTVIEKGALDTSGLGTLLVRCIAAMYKKGYDEITLNLESPEQIEKIQELLQKYFMGFEIVSQGKSTCTIKTISKGMEEEFDALLRRIFLVQKGMGTDFVEAVKESDYARLKSIRTSEDVNNRLTTICRRVLNKKGKTKNIAFMYGTVEQLECIADEYRDLINYIIGKKPKIGKELMEMFKQINKMFEMYYECFYKFDKNTAIRINEMRATINAKTDELFAKKLEPKIVHHLKNMANLIGQCLTLKLCMGL